MRTIIADTRRSYRWFVATGAHPPGHPLAKEPINGTYDASEKEAREATRNMIDCFGGLFPPERLVIEHEEAPLQDKDPEQEEFYLGES